MNQMSKIFGVVWNESCATVFLFCPSSLPGYENNMVETAFRWKQQNLSPALSIISNLILNNWIEVSEYTSLSVIWRTMLIIASSQWNEHHY